MSDTYVTDHARERGLPIVIATTFELLRIADGHPMMLGTLDGQEVCMKLASAEEFLEAQRRGIEHLRGLGIDRDSGPPPSTYAEAEELTRPISQRR